MEFMHSYFTTPEMQELYKRFIEGDFLKECKFLFAVSNGEETRVGGTNRTGVLCINGPEEERNVILPFPGEEPATLFAYRDEGALPLVFFDQPFTCAREDYETYVAPTAGVRCVMGDKTKYLVHVWMRPSSDELDEEYPVLSGDVETKGEGVEYAGDITPSDALAFHPF